MSTDVQDESLLREVLEKLDEALLKRALEALEHHTELTRPIQNTNLTIQAIRARLESNARIEGLTSVYTPTTAEEVEQAAEDLGISKPTALRYLRKKKLRKTIEYGDITEEDILRDVLLALFKELP